MKKKLLISLAGVFGFLIGGLLITSYVLAQKLRTLAEQRKSEPSVVPRGRLAKPKLKPHKFQYTVCDYFPMRIHSETPEDKSYGKALCDVTYKNEKLALVYSSTYVPDLLTIFDHPVMSDLRDRPAIEKLRMIFEAKGPGAVNFLITRKEFQQSLLYLLNGMHRKFKSWDRYDHEKYLVYSWDITRGSFKEIKVQLLSDQVSLTCLGASCMEYLFQTGVL